VIPKVINKKTLQGFNMKKLIAATILLFSSLAFSQVTQLPVLCAPAKQIMSELKDKKVVFVGVREGPKPVTYIIFMDDDGSWVYVGFLDDVACLISGGNKLKINTDLSTKKLL
jgi:hypothetical protein